MNKGFQTISPVDQSLIAERPWASHQEINTKLDAASAAKIEWQATPLTERIEAVRAFFESAVKDQNAIVEELAWQIGRPVSHGPGELKGWLSRGRRMLELAPEALADLARENKPGVQRFIRREPLGTVLVLSPWNYPWLTAINTLVPALVAGNVVLLKHSDQTPLVSERISKAARDVGLPEGVLDHVHMSHEDIAKFASDSRINFIAFTGSVEGGRAVRQAAGKSFAGVSLELGGKDPAYVCEDADIDKSAAALAEGAYFNAGQTCCGIERIYVQRSRYDDFLEAFAEHTKREVLGDPLETTTTLGPVVRLRNAENVQTHIDEALQSGARRLVEPDHFPEQARGLPYMAPQPLIDVNHEMLIMREETFGPTVGIMPVDDDKAAIALMNDSRYGLTASIWTPDAERALRIGAQVETGTWFMNRCDYLDPDLVWTGVKDSGHGQLLSPLGYHKLTQPKSYYLRTDF